MARVVACGLAVLDVVQRVDHVPAADEKLVADDLRVAAGGPAANAAVTLAALGVRARLVTRLGSTPLGSLVAADLTQRGVELTDLAGPLDSPAVSTVLVTAGTGERAVVSVNATRRAGAPGPDPDWPELLAGADLLLVDGHHLDLALGAAGAARAAGVPVLLDGGSWKPGLERLLALVDVAVVSADFVVPGSSSPTRPGPAGPGADGLAALAALGPQVVARSRGAAPIELWTGGRRTRLAVEPVAVVDTLGAGDVLHGALAAWLATTGGPVDDGLAWAAAIASRSVAAAGAHGWQADAAYLAVRRAELG